MLLFYSKSRFIRGHIQRSFATTLIRHCVIPPLLLLLVFSLSSQSFPLQIEANSLHICECVYVCGFLFFTKVIYTVLHLAFFSWEFQISILKRPLVSYREKTGNRHSSWKQRGHCSCLNKDAGVARIKVVVVALERSRKVWDQFWSLKVQDLEIVL